MLFLFIIFIISCRIFGINWKFCWIAIYTDGGQPNHLGTNQDATWPPYGGSGGSSAGALSSGSSSSSTISSSYPSYLGCNVTSSPSATYNPPVLTYTDLGVGGSGSTPSSNNTLNAAIAHGQIVPTTVGMTHFSFNSFFIFQLNHETFFFFCFFLFFWNELIKSVISLPDIYLNTWGTQMFFGAKITKKTWRERETIRAWGWQMHDDEKRRIKIESN